MARLIYIIIFLVGPGIAWPASAQYQRPGSTDGDFLKIGVSARAAGMGDAFIAAARGPDAMFYNPAALSWIDERTHVMLNHTAWFADINHQFLAVSHRFGFGTFGASITALYTDEMAVRTPLQPGGTGETFYSHNTRASVGYSRWLTDRVTFGGTVSYINLSLYQDFSRNAFAVDIAASYSADFRDFRFAMMIGNLGSDVQFIDEAYPLPVHFTFGLSMNAVETAGHRVLVSGSAEKPNDGQPLGQVGAEYAFQDVLFLRGGYKFNYDVASFAAGAGLKADLSRYAFRFDYAYSDFASLGVAHRFGIGLGID
jgi:hypothetical protein